MKRQMYRVIACLTLCALLAGAVPPASAGQIAEAAADGQTHMIPGCDHTFNVFSGDFTALNDAVKATTDFILGAYAEAQQAA